LAMGLGTNLDDTQIGENTHYRPTCKCHANDDHDTCERGGFQSRPIASL
jgi:hypothetical protein